MVGGKSEGSTEEPVEGGVKGTDIEKTEYVEDGTTPSMDLEEIYGLIGVGKSQYILWVVLASITYADTMEAIGIATIVPILRCEWELDLVWETMINVSSILFAALSGGFLGKLSDMYGRRRMLSISLVIFFSASCLSSLAHSPLQFLILRCIAGISLGITFPTAIIFSAEVVKSKYRETGPLLVVFVNTLSMFIMAISAYAILNTVGWRWFVVVSSLPLIVCFVFLRLVPESPRYLVVSGADDEARKAVEWMARWNNTKLPESYKLTVHQDQDLGSIKDILAPEYRKETILLSAIYCGNLLLIRGVLVFIPLALYSGFCGGALIPPEHTCIEVKQSALKDLAIIMSGAGLATAVGYISAVKLGRGTSFKIFGTVGLVSVSILYKCITPTVTKIIFFLVKFFVSSHNMISLIVVPELYPTTIRSTAMGFINSFGKIGATLGAVLVYVLYYVSPYLVVSLFVATALVVAVSSWLWNRETKNMVIRDTRDRGEMETRQ